MERGQSGVSYWREGRGELVNGERAEWS